MVLLASAQPIAISTEVEAQKQPQDESETTTKPAKSKAAKMGADGSPLTLTTKMKSKELKQQAAAAAAAAAATTVSPAPNATATAPTSTTQPAAAPANTTPSIIKFISKMSNKNIKLVQVGNEGAPTINPAPVVADSTPTASPAVQATNTASNESQPEPAPIKVQESKSFDIIPVERVTSPVKSVQVNEANCKPVASNENAVVYNAVVPTPGTPRSPKALTATSSGTAEKRCKLILVEFC
jgi:hypothetical protein